MKFKVAKVVGLNSDQEAAVVSSFGSEDNLLIIVLSLVCDDAFGRGRQLMSDLADIFFASEEGLSGRLSTIFNEAKEKLTDTEQFSILLGSISGKVLYLVGEGSVKVVLKRLDKSSIILDQGTGRLISGFLQEGDRIFLSTDNLAKTLARSLPNHLELPLTQWEEEIKLRISGENIESEDDLNEPLATSGAIVDVTPDEEVVIPRTISKPPESFPEYQSNSEMSQNRQALVQKLLGNTTNLISKLPSGGKIKLILAGIIICVVLVGGGLKFKSIKDSQNKVLFDQYLQAANDNYNAAQNLKTLNPVDAASKLAEAKDDINKALKIDSKNAEALSLKNNIENGSTEVTKSAQVNFSEYLSLDLIKKGFSAQKMSLSGGNLLLLGFDNSLFTVNLAKKSNQLIADKNKLGQANLASISDTKAVVYSSDKGVLEVDLGNKGVSTVSKPDSNWKEIDDLVGFGGNVYLLDSKANQIWKYLPTSTGFSDARNYLTSDTKTNLSGATKMQIESSVYVLKSDGEILRFTKGVADNFSYSGLDKGVKNPKSFFTSSDTDSLYVLDSGNSRLLVFDKSGVYQNQYLGDKFATASDLVVDESAKKVYLLDNNTVYTMDLK